MKKIKNVTKGFTLIELLVVVLIISILAAIAVPQYKIVLAKAKVASILPLMRRWKDAMHEWQIIYGDYCKNGRNSENNCNSFPNGDELGVNWPNDWKNAYDDTCGNSVDCYNENWHCSVDKAGTIYCRYKDNSFHLRFYQYDFSWSIFRGKLICYGVGDNGKTLCQRIGGKFLYQESSVATYYSL